MKLLFVNLSDYSIPPPNNIIRADTYVSVPLAMELQKRGHEVTFICSPGSTVEVEKIFTSHKPLASIMSLDKLMEKSNMAKEIEITFWLDVYYKLIEYSKKEKYDIIHFHTNVPLSELTAVAQIDTPCLFTLHSLPKYPEIHALFFKEFNTRTQNYFNSISDYQQKKFPYIPFISTVHNGILAHTFSFDETGGTPLLFAGRISPEKGVKDAIQTAINTKHQIIVTGNIDAVIQDTYFSKEISPLMDKNRSIVNFFNHTDRSMIFSFYKKGKAILIPIQWDEPFGLVMTESMARGTPVIAYARGSVPEIIKDGETGFIVNPSDDDIRGNWIVKKTGFEGLCEAVERIYAMPQDKYLTMRKTCRKHVEKNFTVEAMVDTYETVYKQIINENKNT